MAGRRKNNLLVEPPSCATGDIAFNLIVFFLVCASVAPDSGRKQVLPRGEETKQQEKSENVDVKLTRTTVSVNGEPMKLEGVLPKLKALFATKPRPEDRVVIVRTTSDTPYHFWIDVTAAIEAVGGTVTIQREEEQTVIAN